MAVTVAELDKALARWQSKLKRAVNTIDKLQKRRKRVVAKAERVAPPGAAKPKFIETVMRETTGIPDLKVPDTSIPDFLKRTKDDEVADQIKAEQAAIKKAKAAGRIAKMKAKQRGDLKKMPLTGRAALDAIRNG